MVRSIEIPEPIFEADVAPRWDHENDKDVFVCTVLVGGKYVVFEKTYIKEPLSGVGEDQVKDEFLAEFAARMKSLLST